MMFDTVLVANRGEIAVRVMRTLRRLGIRSVGVYSDPDAGARHVLEADVAVRLGPAAAAASYLCVDRLLDAAAATAASALHPGYGFLSESTALAAACAAAGLVFVGPPVHAVEVMGDKIRAKLTVQAAGVPVVPGCTEPGLTDAALVAAADDIGFPVLVKPSAGGGGKGMRLVRDPASLREAVASARREAAAAFGDDTLFLELYVTRPRHIEVQVLADTHGHVVHLGERECSLQRRHQKVVEEAPCVLLGPGQRRRMGAAAVEVARAVGYTGVGTVEFLMPAGDPDTFFFLEMNTRLQVEHPVTELVTGLDLVEQQLRVAAGEELALVQADVRLSGCAVEARVYAEDPAHGFLPTGGRVLALREPAEEGVRIDSSLVERGVVGTTYDPLLSKVIAWAPDRRTALSRLQRALAAQVVLGVGTNLAFLQALLASSEVQGGELDTDLVERSLSRLVSDEVPDEVYGAYAMSRLLDRASVYDAGRGDPWEAADGWRASGGAETTERVAAPDGSRLLVRVRGHVGDAQVSIGESVAVPAAIRRVADGMLLTWAGTTVRVLTAAEGPVTWIWLGGRTYALSALQPPRRDAVEAADGDVRSPMPGSVIALRAAAGDSVQKGDVLVVVEAMKMEHALRAPHAGTVERMAVRSGEQVVVGQLVATVSGS